MMFRRTISSEVEASNGKVKYCIKPAMCVDNVQGEGGGGSFVHERYNLSFCEDLTNLFVFFH